MADFPTPDPSVTPTFINTFGLYSVLAKATGQGSANPAALTWVANHAVYCPVVVPHPYPVRRVFWANGSTITTSNADFGIYNSEGTRLYSTGSTALSGTTAPQYTDVTDFVLTPGRYYFACTCDNTTARITGYAMTTTVARLFGVYQQGTALPLPATMASAVAATQALYPLCGITRTASGF